MEFWGGLAFSYLPLKRFYKYILKRLIGSFLRNDIDLEQLDVQLYRGIVQLKSLELDVTQFNLAAAEAGFLVHFVSGFVGTIKMDIPWRHLLGEACKIHVDGLSLVLAKGAPQDILDRSASREHTGFNCKAPGSDSQVIADSIGSGRYSNEGVETLSRLVKHVLGKTQASFRDTSVSIQHHISSNDTCMARQTGTLLRAGVSSVLLSSEHEVVESEVASKNEDARYVEVGSITLSVVGSGSRCTESFQGMEQDIQEEAVLLSTADPFATVDKSGELYIRRRKAETTDTGSSIGMFLDFELSFPALRMALPPVAWKSISFFLSAFEQDEVVSRIRRREADELSDCVPTSSINPVASMRASSMVQPFVESSISGSTRQTGFWHELYHLYEVDAQLEEESRNTDEVAAGSWDEPNAQAADFNDTSMIGAPVSSLCDFNEWPRSEEDVLGLIVGCTFKVRVMQIDCLLAFSGDPKHNFGANDMVLKPSPIDAISADQLQIFTEQWEFVATLQFRPPSEVSSPIVAPSACPALTLLCCSVGVYLHQQRLDSETLFAQDLERHLLTIPVARSSADLDPVMFSSARSTLLGQSLAFRPGYATPPIERQLSEGSTDESIGGSEESFLASSLHSFDSPMAGSINPLAQAQHSSAFGCEFGTSEDTRVNVNVAGTGSPRDEASTRGWHSGNFYTKLIFHLNDRSHQLDAEDEGTKLHHPCRDAEHSNVSRSIDRDDASDSRYQFRLDLREDAVDVETAKTQQALMYLQIECDPLVFRFCARSICSIASGVSCLQDLMVANRVSPHPRSCQPPTQLTQQTRRLFALSALAPLLRFELDLGAAQDTRFTIIADLTAPRIVAQSVGQEPLEPVVDAVGECFREISYIEIADAVCYLCCRSDTTGDCAGQMQHGNDSCIPIVTIDANSSEDNLAKGRLSIFQFCSEASVQERHEEYVPDRAPPLAPNRALAGDTEVPALSDWTKISVLPIESERRSAKSSMMLQDLRDASQQFWRPRRNPCLVEPLSQPARVSGVCETTPDNRGYLPTTSDCPKQTEDRSTDIRHSIREGQLELQLKFFGTVRTKLHHHTLLSLQEACSTFAAGYAVASMQTSEGRETSPVAAESTFVGNGRGVFFGGSIAIDSVCFDMLHEQSMKGMYEQFRFQISPVRCRFVQYCDFGSEFCVLGQDLCLEAKDPSSSKPEQLIKPWFSRTSQEARNSHNPNDGPGRSNLTSSFDRSSFSRGAFAMRACDIDSVIFPVFAGIESGKWLDTHGLLLKIGNERQGPMSDTCISLKLNRIGVSVHPENFKAYRQLISMFRRPETSTNAPAPPSMVSIPAPSGTTVCNISLMNCIVDLPSEAHFRCLCSAEHSDRFDGDQWRAVAHVDDIDLSYSFVHDDGTQIANISMDGLHLFFVDHVKHLSQLDLLIATPDPRAALIDRGFARIFELSGAKAIFRSQASQMVDSQSLEISVDSLGGHVCSDTIRSLLCMAMELSEDTTLQDCFGANDTALSQTKVCDKQSFKQLGRAVDLPAAFHQEAPRTTPTEVDILNNIDMSAFEWNSVNKDSETSIADASGTFSSCQMPATALEGCLIEDYIRTQQEQQTVHSPIQTQATNAPLLSTLDPLVLDPDDDNPCERPLNVTGAEASDRMQSSSSVIVGLFDISAFSTDELQELSFQDEVARRDVAAMLFKEDLNIAGASTVQQKSALRADPTRRLQDGSVAMWLIDPDEVNVLQDHFGDCEPHPPDIISTRPAQALPIEFSFTFRCKEASLSLYGGSDFADEMQGKASVRAATPDINPRKRTTYLMLHLQDNIFELTTFDAKHAARAENFNDSELRRRFNLRIMNYSIIDHIQGSVFSHLLSYKEDDYQRPRQSHVEMLNLQVEEVIPQLAMVEPFPVPEYKVDIRLLPLHLTIDQDTVDFLTDFVQLCFLPMYVEEESQDVLCDNDSAIASDICARPFDSADTPTGQKQQEAPAQNPDRRPAMVFQRFSISAFLVSVDYRAKRLDVNALRRGELWELMNLLPLLEGLEVAFRKVTVGRVEGVSEILSQLVNAWSTDLNRTQILRSLTGVTPIRSFVNIGGGFVEMVLEPLRLYRAGNDSQQVSGALLRGLVSFLKHVTVESIDITERIFVGTQSALEYVNTCLQEPREANSSSSASPLDSHTLSSLSQSQDLALSEQWTPVERGAGGFLQPGSVSEGLQHACTNLARGVRHAGKAVVSKPLLEMQRGAPKGKVLQSIASGIPVCILRPAIGATAAAAMALRGLKNSVDPAKRREGERKYKEPE